LPVFVAPICYRSSGAIKPGSDIFKGVGEPLYALGCWWFFIFSQGIPGIGDKKVCMKILDRLFSYIKEEKKTLVSVGRNDICWCGSGRKYKRCHLETDEEKRRKKAM
jgi:hypothetical protein